jgi:hypothetical protein
LSLLDTHRKAARGLQSLWRKGDVHSRQSRLERGLSLDDLLHASDRLLLRTADDRRDEDEPSDTALRARVRGPQVATPILLHRVSRRSGPCLERLIRLP